MQASRTAIAGSNAIALPEVVGILGERLHRRPLGVDLCLQCQHVLQLRAAMPADKSERQFTAIHAVNDEWTGHAQNLGRVVWAEFLILGENRNPLTLEK